MKTRLTVSTWARGLILALMFATSISVFGQGVIVVNPQPQPSYSVSGTPIDFYIDINGDGTPDFILRTQDSYTSVNNAVLIPLGSNEIVIGGSYGSFVANMANGESVGSSLSPIYQWSNNNAPISVLAILLGQQSAQDGNFWGQTNGYIGFDMVISGANYYGWMQVSNLGQDGLAGDTGFFGTITQWAYQSTPNTPIIVGAVPEPSACALLSLGSLAFWILRRR